MEAISRQGICSLARQLFRKIARHFGFNNNIEKAFSAYSTTRDRQQGATVYGLEGLSAMTSGIKAKAQAKPWLDYTIVNATAHKLQDTLGLEEVLSSENRFFFKFNHPDALNSMLDCAQWHIWKNSHVFNSNKPVEWERRLVRKSLVITEGKEGGLKRARTSRPE